MTLTKSAQLSNKRAKLISGIPDSVDGRKVILVLNKAAFKKITPHYESLRRSIEELVASYSDEEIKVIADFPIKSTLILENDAVRLRK